LRHWTERCPSVRLGWTTLPCRSWRLRRR
jgi:hypothetical protein